MVWRESLRAGLFISCMGTRQSPNDENGGWLASVALPGKITMAKSIPDSDQKHLSTRIPRMTRQNLRPFATIRGLEFGILWDIERGQGMGDRRVTLRLDFDDRLMFQFRSSAITSDAGLLAHHELNNALGLTDACVNTLAASRTGKKRPPSLGRRAPSVDIRTARQLRGCERRQETVPGSSEAPGRWRPSDHPSLPPRPVR
jgi:hypothetical protein